MPFRSAMPLPLTLDFRESDWMLALRARIASAVSCRLPWLFVSSVLLSVSAAISQFTRIAQSLLAQDGQTGHLDIFAQALGHARSRAASEERYPRISPHASTSRKTREQEAACLAAGKLPFA
jgi:hypothetical protein